MKKGVVAAIVGLGLCAAPARADWNGDYHGDVLATNAAGQLLMYRGNGTGGWITGRGEQIGTGWTFPTVVSPGDFTGDGKPDVLAIDATGRMLLYRGNGTGGWITGRGEQIGTGWGNLTPVLAGGDFSGDGKPDVLAVDATGRMLLYRGNGTGGWITGRGEQIGTGWGNFTAIVGGGDFDGDGKPDVLARQPDGRLLLYHGTGAGGWIKSSGDQIGTGWAPLRTLTLVPGSIPPPPPPPPPAPPVVPVPGGSVQVIKDGKHCTLSGRRMRVTLKIKHVRGRAAPRVVKVSFFVRRGAKIVDHHRPYVVHLRMRQPAGHRGRVFARVYFRRAGSRELKHKLVSRRFRICG